MEHIVLVLDRLIFHSRINHKFLVEINLKCICALNFKQRLFKYLDQRSMKTKKMFSDNFIITKADVTDLTINI